jgi:glycosyltransferase involved in cell wall biosynthesis
VEFLSWYNVEDLNRMLDHVHVGLIPSIWEEAFGYVGLEFLAKGIPIIGNARGGIVDYTKDGLTGWVNRSSTAEELAAIMAAIVEDPSQVVTLNSRILARRAELVKTMDTHGREMDELYRQVINRRAAGPHPPHNAGGHRSDTAHPRYSD